MIRAVLVFLILFASISGVFFVLRGMVKTPEQLKRLVETMVFVSFVAIISLFLLVCFDETNRYMEPDYGPPDPPPQICYETRARYTAILSEEELEEWIQENLGKKFKIFKIEPIQYKTAVKVEIVK